MNKFRLSSDSLFNRPGEDKKINPARIIFLSVEGNKSEQDYFKWLQKNRTKCGIDSLIHVHALRRSQKDTNSSVKAVFELLQDYISLREDNGLPKSLRKMIPSIYSDNFIKQYLNKEKIDPNLKEKFEKDLEIAAIDYSYHDFLRNYKGTNNNDVFGVVLDRDWRCHTQDQLKLVLENCKEKKYKFFLSNPSFEFWLLLHLVDVKTVYANRLNEFLENDRISKKHTFVSGELSRIARQNKSISENMFLNLYLPNIDVASNRAENDFETDLEKLIGIGVNEENEDAHGKIGTNLYALIKLLKQK